MPSKQKIFKKPHDILSIVTKGLGMHHMKEVTLLHHQCIPYLLRLPQKKNNVYDIDILRALDFVS